MHSRGRNGDGWGDSDEGRRYLDALRMERDALHRMPPAADDGGAWSNGASPSFLSAALWGIDMVLTHHHAWWQALRLPELAWPSVTSPWYDVSVYCACAVVIALSLALVLWWWLPPTMLTVVALLLTVVSWARFAVQSRRRGGN